MALQFVFFLVGLVALYLGAEWVVRGAASLARSVGISSLVIGLTLVSMGTSAPELVVSGVASARGQGAIAFGNVIGSNIVNVALILGIAAVITSVSINLRLIAREIPIMIAASVLVLLLALDGTVSRMDGGVLAAGMVAYIVYIVWAARRDDAASATDMPAGLHGRGHGGRARHLLLIVGGCAVLVVGARLLVDASVEFAEALGVSQAVIAVTVIAIGTSLPELATSTVAAVRREIDVAVGNVVGSNLCNVLGILGASALIGPIPAPAEVLRFEYVVMLAFSMLLLPLAITRLRIERWEGIAFLVGYAAFMIALLARAGLLIL